MMLSWIQYIKAFPGYSISAYSESDALSTVRSISARVILDTFGIQRGSFSYPFWLMLSWHQRISHDIF